MRDNKKIKMFYVNSGPGFDIQVNRNKQQGLMLENLKQCAYQVSGALQPIFPESKQQKSSGSVCVMNH